MNEGSGQTGPRLVAARATTARSGSTAGVDASDPSWIEACLEAPRCASTATTASRSRIVAVARAARALDGVPPGCGDPTACGHRAALRRAPRAPICGCASSFAMRSTRGGRSAVAACLRSPGRDRRPGRAFASHAPGARDAIWDGKWHHVAGTFDGSTVRLSRRRRARSAGSARRPRRSIDYVVRPTERRQIGSYGTQRAAERPLTPDGRRRRRPDLVAGAARRPHLELARGRSSTLAPLDAPRSLRSRRLASRPDGSCGSRADGTRSLSCSAAARPPRGVSTPSARLRMKTYVAKPTDRERNWLVVDAEGQTLGRLATQIADALRGKRKPTYTPHIDTGDFVVVVNAEKISVTGSEADREDVLPPLGLPGRPEVPHARTTCSSAGRKRSSASRSRGCCPATVSAASSSPSSRSTRALTIRTRRSSRSRWR